MVLIRADLAPAWSSLVALGAQGGIRICGSWRRAAEEMERPRWVKVQGGAHSAWWGTAHRCKGVKHS